MAVSHPTPGRSSSCCCFRTQGCLPMPMRLWWGPEPHVYLFAQSSGNVPRHWSEECPREGVILDPFADTLAKFIALVLVGLALSLANLYSVWKQFLVAMKDSRHITPANPHFLWQPSGGLSWWLFQTSPQVLKACSCSGSQTCTTVGLVADYHTARVSERLYQASGGAAKWGFHPWEFATELPLDKILLKSSRILVRCWTQNCFSESISVSDETYICSLCLAWK